jgi:hypothetical protein
MTIIKLDNNFIKLDNNLIFYSFIALAGDKYGFV